MPETPEAQFNEVVRLLPTNDEPIVGEEALEALQEALDPTQANSVDLIVAQQTPVPLGRAPLFDFSTGRFVRNTRSQGPVETRGNETLKNWIEKCLSTARGAHPIHPPGYGLVNPSDMIGGPVIAPPADLETRVRDALTFHPRIANVTNFAFAYDADDDYLSVSFVVVTDSDETVHVDTVLQSP